MGLVFGTHVIHLLPPAALAGAVLSRKRVFLRGYGEEGQDIVEGLPVERDRDVRAWLTIMVGCNNFCLLLHRTACARARAQPYPAGRWRKSSANCCGLGYERDCPAGDRTSIPTGKTLDPPLGFPRAFAPARPDGRGINRLRFMTSHPKDATHELLDVMAQGRHICHSLHLPFQAGQATGCSGEMNRGYTRRQYLDLIAYAKRQMPDMTFTSDVIVGFPGETYEEFQENPLRWCGRWNLLPCLRFCIPPREGTPAARMPDPVPPAGKKPVVPGAAACTGGSFPARGPGPGRYGAAGAGGKNTAKSAGFSSGKPKGIFPVILREICRISARLSRCVSRQSYKGGAARGDGKKPDVVFYQGGK